MRIIRTFFIILVLTTSAFADIVGEVLREFAISDTKANRNIIVSIQKSISNFDVVDFKQTIEKKPNNAFIVKSEISKIEAPKFLMFLAMAESRFTNFATSGKQASGMWQFMPSTAKAYGLDINAHVDERRDPFLSTDIAFSYMADLNHQFDDKWYLSLMAYNCGDGCMKKAIKQTGTIDFSALLNSSSLPNETKNFIKKIIKYTIISKTPHVNNAIVNLEPEVEVEKIKVDGGTKLSTVAKSIGLSTEDMRNFNPHIKNDKAPEANETYHFYIPQDKMNLYALNYIGKLIRGEKELKKSFEIHRVAKNETLDDIAKKWSVGVNDIKDLNKLKNDKLVAGYELKIPLTKLSLGDSKEYVIKNGDTLSEISKKFDVSLKELVVANDIDKSKIRVGDRIVIP